MHKSYKDLFAAASKSHDFIASKVKYSFAAAINRLIRESGVSRADFAAKVGVKPPYITKVLCGDANFTIGTMVKICEAAGAALEISVRKKEPSADSHQDFDEIIDAIIGARASSSHLLGLECLMSSVSYNKSQTLSDYKRKPAESKVAAKRNPEEYQVAA